MSLINCKINLILTWSEDCVISPSSWVTRWATTGGKVNVPTVTLWTQDNVKV